MPLKWVFWMLVCCAPMMAQNDQQIVLGVSNLSLGVVDAVQSCQHPQWEVQLPMKNCAGIASVVLGGKAAELLAQRWMVKHGHPRLAKAIALAGIGSTSYALGYSFSHR